MKRLKAVLLIDADYISNKRPPLRLNKQILEELKIIEQVFCISDHISALVYLARATATPENREKHLPDIIFLDLDMPGMKGFDFLQRLKETPGCEDLATHTVLLTSSMDEAERIRRGACGIHAYVVKPLTKTKAKKIVDSFLDTG